MWTVGNTLADTEDLAHYRLSGIHAMQSTRLVSRGGRLVGMLSTHWRDVHGPSERELGLVRRAGAAGRRPHRTQDRPRTRWPNPRRVCARRWRWPELGTCRWDWSTHEMRGNDAAFPACADFDPAAGVIPEEQYRDNAAPRGPRNRLAAHPPASGGRAASTRRNTASSSRMASCAGSPRRDRSSTGSRTGGPGTSRACFSTSPPTARPRRPSAESELRFRTLANALPQVIWTNDPDGKANYFNQGWYRVHGPFLRAIQRPRLAGRRPPRRPARLRRKNGGAPWAQARGNLRRRIPPAPG